jgi:hypothetical protein
MKKIRKYARKNRAVETEIVESTRTLSSYGYCELPAHFFDRALAQSKSDGSSVLTVATWGGRNVMSFGTGKS